MRCGCAATGRWAWSSTRRGRRRSRARSSTGTCAAAGACSSPSPRAPRAADAVTGRYTYRYERPRYSWADTPDRPRYEGPAPDRLAQRLGDAWTAKRVPGMTGLVRTTRAIRKPPEPRWSRTSRPST